MCSLINEVEGGSFDVGPVAASFEDQNIKSVSKVLYKGV